MDRFWTLKLLVTVSLLGAVCHCWDATVQGPVKAIRGSCVLVPCHTVSYSEVKWYKYKGVGYPVVYSKDRSEIMEEFKGRTSVPGYSQDGNCSLRIDNVKQQDGEVDLYVWIWRYGGDHKGFYDRTIKINVLDPVAPRMSVKKEQTEGTAFSATCKCRHSCPSSPPQISWVGLNAISNVLSHRKDSEGLWETEATATFKVTRVDQNKHLSCSCAFVGSSNSVALNVSYAPVDVNIVHTGSSTVVEGESISLRCVSKSKPEPTTYEWKVNPVNTQIRKEGSTAVLQDVRRHTSLTCVAVNSVGRGESRTLLLDVKYIIGYTGGSTVVEGNKISLKCTAESRPTSTQYGWSVTQNGTTTRYIGETVVLQDVMRNTSVSCTASNTIRSGQSKTQWLAVHYAPTDVKVEYTGGSAVVEGNKISLRCTAESRPTSTQYGWSVTQNGTTTRYIGETVVLQDVMRDTSVSCTASNTIGSGQSQTQWLAVHYAPSILPGSFCFSRSGTLQCECRAEAWPSAVISWTVDGSDALFPDFSNTTQHNGTVTVSELTGPPGHNITCTAKNSAGTKVTQIPVSSEENGLAMLTAGVAGAAVVLCIILGFAVTIMIRKKRSPAVPPGDLPLAKDMRPDKVCHDYFIESDEDVYVNQVHNHRVYEEQDTGSCIYENYDTKS